MCRLLLVMDGSRDVRVPRDAGIPIAAIAVHQVPAVAQRLAGKFLGTDVASPIDASGAATTSPLMHAYKALIEALFPNNRLRPWSVRTNVPAGSFVQDGSSTPLVGNSLRRAISMACSQHSLCLFRL